jgi:hypothetical protein
MENKKSIPLIMRYIVSCQLGQLLVNNIKGATNDPYFNPAKDGILVLVRYFNQAKDSLPLLLAV